MSLIPQDITDLRDRLDEQREADRGQQRFEAYTVLHKELHEALMHDPARSVQTPGFFKDAHTAAAVINDSFDSSTGDASLRELLSIIGEVAQLDTPLGLRAESWINARAEEHARFHADDLADQWMGYA